MKKKLFRRGKGRLCSYPKRTDLARTTQIRGMLSALLLSITCLFQVVQGASHNNSLSKPITLPKGPITIQDALRELEKQTDYHFFYNHAQVNTKAKVKIEVQAATLENALGAIFAESNVSWKVKGSQVLLYAKRDLGLAPEALIKSRLGKMVVVPEFRVSGQVKDINGEAIPGANILLKGTSQGTTTDVNGNFNLTIPTGDGILVFSFIGFSTQEVAVSGRSILNVTLAENRQLLNEVVVVGYGTQKRKEVTSSIATVKADDFNKGSARSPMELIQGKVAGLNITKTRGNNPNEGTSIQLRGVPSLSSTIAPLIVIDGIPGGNLDLIQQDDIESFDVLKDGSAAAIYGTRGNGGVILITTKKGSASEPRFEYNTYFQRDYVDKKPDFLSAEQFRQKIAEGQIGTSSDLGGSTDMFQELINKSNLSQYHNFSASGGAKKGNYRASLYYNDFQGIAVENGRKQFGGRLNINQKGMDEKLELQLNMAANINKANLLGGGTGDFEQAVSWNPTAPIYKPDGTFFEIQENYNPVARYANRLSERDQQTFSGDARLTYEIIPDLKLSVFGIYQRDMYNDRGYRSLNDFEQRVGTSWQGMGYASKSNSLNWSKTLESTLSYNKSIQDHSFTGLLGYSYQYSTSEGFNVNNNGFTTDGFYDWNLGSGSAINNTALPRPGIGSSKSDNTLIAFFGRLGYSFRDKYFAQVMLRREGSSRFGANNKWGNFPAVSAGWALSNEAFLKDVNFINNLKVRAGYGVTGNQGIPNYQSLITLGTGGVYPQSGIFYQTYGPSRNPNPNLRWEKKAEFNFGIDYELFNHRLSGAIDIYNRNTTDLLSNYAAQQPSYVHSSLYTNVGAIRNRGIELLVSVVPVIKKDFRWSIDMTASSQFNRLTQLSNEQFKATFLTFADIPNPGAMGPAIRLYEGGVVGNFYGKRFAGFSDDGNWLFYKADGSVAPSTQITENDWAILGNGVPKYNLGLNQNFTYKNWDLSILFRGKFGFDILNLQEIFYGNRKYLPRNIFNSAYTRHDALRADPMYSDYYIEKGDFVKLDNLTLGYNFKFKGNKVRNLRIYATGRNLLTLTKYTGLDPELQDTGLETGVDSRGFYPRTRSLTMGLNIGF